MLADIVTDAMAVAVVQIPKLEPLALRGVATGRVDDNLLLLGVFEVLCYAAARHLNLHSRIYEDP